MNTSFLVYIGPPLLGAFIGYLTNRVAIRMLFRPLNKWRVLGVPVPMTPGVIPARRHELAENIGEMVGTHLLTSRDIGTALSEERFQDQLHAIVDGWISDALGRDLGPLHTLVPERFQAYYKVGMRTLRYQARMGVHQYIRGNEFEQKVGIMLREQLAMLGARPLNDLVSRESRTSLYCFLDTLVDDLLAGPGAEDRLAAYLRETLRRAADGNRRVSDYLPGQLRELIVATILRRAPAMLGQLSGILNEPPVRERIIRAVRGGVDDFIASLGPIGAMAGSFLDMNSLEDAIRGYLVDKREEISAWLENSEVQERFSAVLVEQISRFMETPVASILERMEPAQEEEICRELARQIMAVLRTRGVAAALSAMLRESFEEMLARGEIPMAEISDRLLGRETGATLRQTLVDEVIDQLRSHRVRRLLDKMMNSMFDAVLGKSIGRLEDVLPAGVRSGITDYAVLSINRILLREVPDLVESLNIRRIVTEKVDSLDLLRLERLLLSIMEEQFKYINLFGGLLGFIIGLANLVIMRLV